jgi:hypothetical protein
LDHSRGQKDGADGTEGQGIPSCVFGAEAT